MMVLIQANITSQLVNNPNLYEEIIVKTYRMLETQEKGNSFPGLTPDQIDFFHQGIINMDRVCHFAITNGLKVLIDAEYTYLNPGISVVALALMLKYNQRQPNVANTYQCYLKVSIVRCNMYFHNLFWSFKAAYIDIAKDIQVVEKHGSSFAAKVVRGAYLEKVQKI